MDIWDHTQLRPERIRFRRNLDFNELRAARDPLALETGQRWLEQSKGLEIARVCKLGMGDYLALSDQMLPSVAKQIEKDLARTSADSLTQPTLRAFLGAMPRESVTESMRRILHCFALRNPRLGYCQGMDHLVLFLLAFHPAPCAREPASAAPAASAAPGEAGPKPAFNSNSRKSPPPAIAPEDTLEEPPKEGFSDPVFEVGDGEERVFWTLCGMVEKLLPEDFFDPPPAMLNGFLAEQRLLIVLAEKVFPRLLQCVGEEAFRQTIELLSHKWMITLFVDCAPLKVICMVWQSFFTREGMDGVITAVLTVLETCQKPVLQKGPDSLLSCVMNHSKAMTSTLMKSGLQQAKYKFDAGLLAKLRNKIREDLARQWNDGVNLHEINRSTPFSLQELQQLQTLFHNIYEKRRQGITRKQFLSLIHDSAPHLEPGLVSRCFTLYDTDKREALNFCELVNCISVLSGHAQPEDKIRLAFDLFDKLGKGFLEREEIEDLALTFIGMVRPYLEKDTPTPPRSASSSFPGSPRHAARSEASPAEETIAEASAAESSEEASAPQTVSSFLGAEGEDPNETLSPRAGPEAPPTTDEGRTGEGSLAPDEGKEELPGEGAAEETGESSQPKLGGTPPAALAQERISSEDVLKLRGQFEWNSFKLALPRARVIEVLTPVAGRMNFLQFRRAVASDPLVLAMVVDLLRVDDLLDNAASQQEASAAAASSSSKCVIC